MFPFFKKSIWHMKPFFFLPLLFFSRIGRLSRDVTRDYLHLHLHCHHLIFFVFLQNGQFSFRSAISLWPALGSEQSFLSSFQTFVFVWKIKLGKRYQKPIIVDFGFRWLPFCSPYLASATLTSGPYRSAK